MVLLLCTQWKRRECSTNLRWFIIVYMFIFCSFKTWLCIIL